MTIKLENEELEQVDEFVYLQSLIAQHEKCTKDINRRSGLASAIVNKVSIEYGSRTTSQTELK